MNLAEFSEVKSLNYDEYCMYLQEKYGLPSKPYLTETWSKTKGITRTQNGLFIHHVREDITIQLSNPEIAKNSPYEYQEPKNLCFCDYLEHLWLHFLIVKNPNRNAKSNENVGIGGIVNFIVPELFTMYGMEKLILPDWKINCFDAIKNDEEVFQEILFELAKIIPILSKEKNAHSEENAGLLRRFFIDNKKVYLPLEDIMEDVKGVTWKKEKTLSYYKVVPSEHIITPGITLLLISNPKFPGERFITKEQNILVSGLLPNPTEDEVELSTTDSFSILLNVLMENNNNREIQEVVEKFNNITNSLEKFDPSHVKKASWTYMKKPKESDKKLSLQKLLGDSKPLDLPELKNQLKYNNMALGAISTRPSLSKENTSLLKGENERLALTNKRGGLLK